MGLPIDQCLDPVYRPSALPAVRLLVQVLGCMVSNTCLEVELDSLLTSF